MANTELTPNNSAFGDGSCAMKKFVKGCDGGWKCSRLGKNRGTVVCMGAVGVRSRVGFKYGDGNIVICLLK